MPNIIVAPTLRTMSAIYRLSRDGGPTSERFHGYVARVEHEWGLVAYNPMAGSAALDAVEQLLAMEAEAEMATVAEQVAMQCDFNEPVTLALVVQSTGMWTDRVASEVDRRISDRPSRAGHGIVGLWSREAIDITDVRRESAAETVRVMWTMHHGAAQNLKTVLTREGLAYAIAGRLVGQSPFGGPPNPSERSAVQEAVDILGDTRVSGDISGVLFGDDVSTAMGWTTLGIPDRAGYRWAIERALQWVDETGAANALRNGGIA